MSRWTHPQCERCWIETQTFTDDTGATAIRRPTRITDPDLERCCFCGNPTIVGIYIRQDPAGLECHHIEDD